MFNLIEFFFSLFFWGERGEVLLEKIKKHNLNFSIIYSYLPIKEQIINIIYLTEICERVEADKNFPTEFPTIQALTIIM